MTSQSAKEEVSSATAVMLGALAPGVNVRTNRSIIPEA